MAINNDISRILFEGCGPNRVWFWGQINDFHVGFVGGSTVFIGSIMGMGSTSSGMNLKWASYAYNILGEYEGPRRWITNMSDLSLNAISYGSNNISCWKAFSDGYFLCNFLILGKRIKGKKKGLHVVEDGHGTQHTFVRIGPVAGGCHWQLVCGARIG